VVSSRPSGGDAQELSSSSDVGSDLFEDWPEANDMATSVYVTLIVEPSGSCAPMGSAPHSEGKPCASSSSQTSRSELAALWRSHHRKPKDVQAPCKKSKRTKKTMVKDNAAMASPRDGLLLAADFDQSDREIMYPHFVEEGFVDLPDRMNK
jgi:hypothetical protein